MSNSNFPKDFNAFSFSEESYSIDKFYTWANDKRGHSEQTRTMFPAGMLSQIAAIVQSKRIPEYKTSQHFIRDAVFHRLKWLADNIDDIQIDKNKLRTVELYSLVVNSQIHLDQLKETEDKLKTALNQAQMNGNFEILNELVVDATRIMEDMPDTYKRNMLEIISRYKVKR